MQVTCDALEQVVWADLSRLRKSLKTILLKYINNKIGNNHTIMRFVFIRAEIRCDEYSIIPHLKTVMFCLPSCYFFTLITYREGRGNILCIVDMDRSCRRTCFADVAAVVVDHNFRNISFENITICKGLL